MYPTVRMRRYRKSEAIRDLVAETEVSPDDLIYPIFVREDGKTHEIPSMPGQRYHSVETAVETVGELLDLGLRAFILFGIPREKDPEGRVAADPEGIVQRTVRALKEEYGDDIVVVTDVCLCQYTTHGHCGLVDEDTGKVLNDPTLEVLAEVALSHAEAGADIVAPSDMMDGRVKVIREALDSEGFGDVMIMSYAAKYHSAFYGPFRDAADSAPEFGDRSTYQMDPRCFRQAIRELELDVEEGADILMIKPAMPYLDVVREARRRFNHPIAAYQVSGEYAMIKAAAEAGYVDYRAAVLESITCIKRAGADLILTYFAPEVVRWLKS